MTTPPPLPASVKRKLRGFTSEQVDAAKTTLVNMARTCIDDKSRLDAARYIVDITRKDEQEYFNGDSEALTALAMLPVDQQAGAAMQLFAQQKISRADLDTILKTVQADQTARIADLERARLILERENKDFAYQLQNGKRIEGEAVTTPVVRQ